MIEEVKKRLSQDDDSLFFYLKESTKNSLVTNIDRKPQIWNWKSSHTTNR